MVSVLSIVFSRRFESQRHLTKSGFELGQHLWMVGENRIDRAQDLVVRLDSQRCIDQRQFADGQLDDALKVMWECAPRNAKRDSQTVNRESETGYLLRHDQSLARCAPLTTRIFEQARRRHLDQREGGIRSGQPDRQPRICRHRNQGVSRAVRCADHRVERPARQA